MSFVTEQKSERKPLPINNHSKTHDSYPEEVVSYHYKILAVGNFRKCLKAGALVIKRGLFYGHKEGSNLHCDNMKDGETRMRGDKWRQIVH
ncbi:hypothetical protein D9619_008991 [Psilocybe cf. subviscida]|uniref:Uncharacterized protein n=1 Tax=Psilocybe cf. subviscida TaxID=2480587 RepID=A0A8H5BW40_9AGAR|nr:hypothetical protein D9619_008991 [Psilocybe cf. subviscida]